jgi:hypothetical protein
MSWAVIMVAQMEAHMATTEIKLPRITPQQKSFLGWTSEFGYFGPNCGWSWKAPGIGFKMADALVSKGLLYRDTQHDQQPCWKLTCLGMHAVKKIGA